MTADKCKIQVIPPQACLVLCRCNPAWAVMEQHQLPTGTPDYSTPAEETGQERCQPGRI